MVEVLGGLHSTRETFKNLYKEFDFDISVLDEGDFHPLQALLLVALSNVENGPWEFDVIASKTMDTVEATIVAEGFEAMYLEVKSDYEASPEDSSTQQVYSQYKTANDILKTEIQALAKSVGIDCEEYMTEDYTCMQILNIALAGFQGFDMKQLDNSVYSSQRMNLILTAMRAGFDISYFQNLDFNEAQLVEILRGLESGVDVSGFAKPDITAKQMFAERLKL